jgi:hypothetical protein
MPDAHGEVRPSDGTKVKGSSEVNRSLVNVESLHTEKQLQSFKSPKPSMWEESIVRATAN